MPTRSAAPRRHVARDDLAWMLLVTERLAARRARLKTDAVAGSGYARAELRALDRALSRHVGRGARELQRLAALAPPSATDDGDINAAIAAETALAGERWYGVGADAEARIERFFGGWTAALALRARIFERVETGEPRATALLFDLDSQLSTLIEQTRALRPLKTIFFKFEGGRELDAYATAVERLLTDLRDGTRAADTFAGSKNVKGHNVPKVVRLRFAEAYDRATRDGATDSGKRERAAVLAFLRTSDAAVREAAQLLGVEPRALRRALGDSDVQAALAWSPVEASFIVLEHLGFGSASTTRKRIATSGGRKTVP